MAGNKTPGSAAAAPGRAATGEAAAPGPFYSITVHEKLVKYGKYHYNTIVLEISLRRPIEPVEATFIALAVHEEMYELKMKMAREGKMIDIAVVSGRMPIWAYGMVIHELLHYVPVLGVYDPKIDGAVIVACHDPHGPYAGEVVKI